MPAMAAMLQGMCWTEKDNEVGSGGSTS